MGLSHLVAIYYFSFVDLKVHEGLYFLFSTCGYGPAREGGC